MVIWETIPFRERLEMVLINLVQKRIARSVTWDRTSRSLKLLCLRKELHCKYATSDDGSYHFNFTKDLLDQLKRSAQRLECMSDYCIVLFCEQSSLPCILTYPELNALVEQSQKEEAFDLFVSFGGRGFLTYAYSNDRSAKFELKFSKQESFNKILRGNTN